jgi:hypothetical protein
MHTLLADPELRYRLGTAARHAIETDHAPQSIAAALEDRIEYLLTTA